MPDNLPERDDPGLAAFAALLRQSIPTTPPLRIDELVFEAGRRSVAARFRYLWQGVSAVLAVLSIGLGCALLDRPTRTAIPAVGRIVIVDAPSLPKPPTAVPTAPEVAVPAYPSPGVPAISTVSRPSMWQEFFAAPRAPDRRTPLQQRQDSIRQGGELPPLPMSMPGLSPFFDRDDDLDLSPLSGGVFGSPSRHH